MSDTVLTALIGAGAVGITALASVLVALISRKRLRPLEETAQQIAGQVNNNGGASLKDGVDRIEAAVKAIRDTQTQHGERLGRLEDRFAEHITRERPR